MGEPTPERPPKDLRLLTKDYEAAANEIRTGIRYTEVAADGLIDELLARRQLPANLDSIARFMSDESYADGFAAGVDQALAILVPAAKKIALLQSMTNHGANCISKVEVSSILGRVPVK